MPLPRCSVHKRGGAPSGYIYSLSEVLWLSVQPAEGPCALLVLMYCTTLKGDPAYEYCRHC